MEKYAGIHVLLDMWDIDPDLLMDLNFISETLRFAAQQAQATLLYDHYHHFGEGQGVTGVLILAESHISIHTWPETGFAALDVFLCGKCDPQDCLPILLGGFKPKKHSIIQEYRGIEQTQE